MLRQGSNEHDSFRSRQPKPAVAGDRYRTQVDWPFLGGIAQSHQPIIVLLGHAAAHEWTLPLIQASLGNAMIVPDGQPLHHTSRQGYSPAVPCWSAPEWRVEALPSRAHETRPTLPIHPNQTGAGPDRLTLYIDHIEIGLSMGGTVQFIQRHLSRCGRDMAADPVLRSLSCALDDGGNLAPTSLHSQQQPRTPLDASIAGMSFHQQGQDGSL